MKIQVGMRAKSKAGRDKDKIYSITEIHGEYVYLVDGEKRCAENPKRKNRKHIQIIGEEE